MSGPIRCAIYTRKSSEEGLEQSFNSLHAQREACEAYICSQRHEGWHLLGTHYDDGGHSGGNLDRPAFKQLMADVIAGKVDTVMVYKVDRLTRSLADFAKIVEQFDSNRVSFVSVTQQFNTTTSMGRLTLNVLLSFAQFEREVTAERIRDKIAASKKKGMWMGGHVPLGYDLRDRNLFINPEEAGRVREIFTQYIRLGCVSALKEHLERCTVRSKARIVGCRETGNGRFSRGALYKILRNHLYVGEIAHKSVVYPGNHEPIIDREQWNTVQRMLVEHRQGVRRKTRATKSSLLTGVLFDEKDNRLTPTHAIKSGKRHRYYTSQIVIRKAAKSDSITRIPAHELETAVTERVLECLQSPQELISYFKDGAIEKANQSSFLKQASNKAKAWPALSVSDQEAFMKPILDRVVVCQSSIEIRVNAGALLKHLNRHDRATPISPETVSDPEQRTFTVSCPFQRSYQGKAPRLILGTTQAPPPASTAAILKAIARARLWYEQIVAGEASNLRDIATKHGFTPRYVKRIFPLASLGPDAISTIMNNEHHAHLSLDYLASQISMAWSEQCISHSRLVVDRNVVKRSSKGQMPRAAMVPID